MWLLVQLATHVADLWWCNALFLLQGYGGASRGAAGALIAAPAPLAEAVDAGVPAADAVGAVGGETAGASVREPEDVPFPLRFDRKVMCVQGHCVAVHLARQLVIVGGSLDDRLHCYNLHDGVERCVIGRGGRLHGQSCGVAVAGWQ